jgi:hypothetical protein
MTAFFRSPAEASVLNTRSDTSVGSSATTDLGNRTPPLGPRSVAPTPEENGVVGDCDRSGGLDDDGRLSTLAPPIIAKGPEVVREIPNKSRQVSEHEDDLPGVESRRGQAVPPDSGLAAATAPWGAETSTVRSGRRPKSVAPASAVEVRAADSRGASDESAAADNSVVMIRLRKGLASDRQRVCHIVALSLINSGTGQFSCFCGATFHVVYVEQVDLASTGGMMPCCACFDAWQAARDASDVDVTETSVADSLGELTRFLALLNERLPDHIENIKNGEVSQARLLQFGGILQLAINLIHQHAFTLPVTAGAASDASPRFTENSAMPVDGLDWT